MGNKYSELIHALKPFVLRWVEADIIWLADHGLLAGLGDDDHTQYLLASGARVGGASQIQLFTNGVSLGAHGATLGSLVAAGVANADWGAALSSATFEGHPDEVWALGYNRAGYGNQHRVADEHSIAAMFEASYYSGGVEYCEFYVEVMGASYSYNRRPYQTTVRCDTGFINNYITGAVNFHRNSDLANGMQIGDGGGIGLYSGFYLRFMDAGVSQIQSFNEAQTAFVDLIRLDAADQIVVGQAGNVNLLPGPTAVGISSMLAYAALYIYRNESVDTGGNASYGLSLDHLVSVAQANWGVHYGAAVTVNASHPSGTVYGIVGVYGRAHDAGAGTIVAGLTGIQGTATSTSAASTLRGGQFESELMGTGGSATSAAALWAVPVRLDNAANTVGTAYGLYVADSPKEAGATLGTQYGIKIESLAAGSNNYAIATGSGLVQFGDQVSITGSADRLQLLVKAYSTQTPRMVEFQDSSSNVLWGVDETGLMETRSMLPLTGYTYSIGTLQKKYLALHVAELWVETLVAQNTIATIGGRVLVGPTTILTTDLSSSNNNSYHGATPAAGHTYIRVKHNDVAENDVLYMEADSKVEFFLVKQHPAPDPDQDYHTITEATPDDYEYYVERNLDGSGANDWYTGDAVFNTGATDEGFIDLYAIRAVTRAGGEYGYGPTIVGNVRNSATYSDWSEHWALGNLRYLYGYGDVTRYGAAFGKYGTGSPWIAVDATDGFRIVRDSVVLGQWDINGAIYIGVQADEHIKITSTALQIRDGATVYTLVEAGAITVGRVASGQSNVYIASGELHLRNNVTDVITLLSTADANGRIAMFEGVIGIGTNGGLYQGTGTFSTPTSGLKLWNATGSGRLALFNDGVQVATLGSGGLYIESTLDMGDPWKAYHGYRFEYQGTKVGGLYCMRNYGVGSTYTMGVISYNSTDGYPNAKVVIKLDATVGSGYDSEASIRALENGGGGAEVQCFQDTSTAGKVYVTATEMMHVATRMHVSALADVVQLTVRGNSTQTNSIFRIETNLGGDLLSVSNAGQLTCTSLSTGAASINGQLSSVTNFYLSGTISGGTTIDCSGNITSTGGYLSAKRVITAVGSGDGLAAFDNSGVGTRSLNAQTEYVLFEASNTFSGLVWVTRVSDGKSCFAALHSGNLAWLMHDSEYVGAAPTESGQIGIWWKAASGYWVIEAWDACSIKCTFFKLYGGS